MKQLFSIGVFAALVCCYLQVSAHGNNMSLQANIQSNSVCNSGTPSCQCNGKMKSLTVVYMGQSGATVKVYKSSTFNSSNLISTFSNVQNGQTLAVSAASIGGQFQSNTFFVIAGGSSNCNGSDHINTSCSSSIIGKTYGSFKVIGYTDGAGSQCSLNVCDGAIDLTVSGGTSPYTYNWSNGSTSQDLMNLCSGTYSVTVKDKNCVSTTRTFTVGQVPSGISVTASSTPNASCQASCSNNHQSSCSGTITLNVSGGGSPYTYDWSNNKTTKDQTGVCSGTYVVTVTDANGCAITKGVTVSEVITNISITAISTSNATCQSSCNGNNGDNDDDGYNNGDDDEGHDGNNAWDDDDGHDGGYDDNGGYNSSGYHSSCSGNYQGGSYDGYHDGDDGNNNGDDDDEGDDNHQGSCNGTIDITIAGGAAPYTYVWSNNKTTEDQTGVCSGCYTVTVTDANGCTQTKTVCVGQTVSNLNLTASSTPSSACLQSLCNGTIDLTVSGGNEPYTFHWSNNITTEDQSGVCSGSYTVTVTNANGCSATKTVSVGQNSTNISLTATSTPDASCQPGVNCTGTINLSVSGGVSPFTYLWSNNKTTQDQTGVCAGAYSVTVTGANGCTATKSVTVTQTSATASCNISGTNSVCPNSTDTFSGGTANSYAWSVNGNASIVGANNQPSVAVQAGTSCGQYILQLNALQGNCTAVCFYTVNIVDQTPPVISGVGQNQLIDCSAQPQFGAPTVSDNCGQNPALTFKDVITPGSCPQSFSITRTWTATDGCGNVSTASQTISLADEDSPGVTVSEVEENIQCPAQPVFGELTIVDNCDPTPSVIFEDDTIAGVCANAYAIVRTWTVVDDCGNASSASQSINVIDLTSPDIIGLGSDQIISCPALPQFNEPIVTDFCGSATLTFEDDTIAGSCANEYTIIRSFLAVDDCGNSSSASQSITVIDENPPVIAGIGEDKTIECSDSIKFSEPVAADECGNAMLTFQDGIIPGSCPNEYIIIREWTAVDGCGNSSSASQAITVKDLSAPETTVPQDVILSCNESTDPSSTGFAFCHDRCDTLVTPIYSDEIIEGQSSGNAVDICINAGDGAYLASTGDNFTADQYFLGGSAFTKNVPIASTTDDVLYQTERFGANGSVFSYDVPVTNGVYAVDLHFAEIFYGLPGNGLSGGAGSRLFDVTIEGTLVLDDYDIFADAGGPAIAIIKTFNATVSDNELNISFDGVVNNAKVSAICVRPMIVQECGLRIQRTWTCTDDCGNTSTASQIITVIDTDAPVISGVGADETIECPAQLHFSEPVATDACGNATVTFVDGIIPGSCPNEYIIIREWTAVDGCGNSSFTSQAITVIDETAPVFSGVGEDKTIECPEIPIFNQPTAADACGAVTVTFMDDITFGDCAYSFSITRIWTATDLCGNSSTVSQTITAVDSKAPVFTFIPADDTMACPIPRFGEPEVEDACGQFSLTIVDDTIFDNAPEFIVFVRSWTAIDGCGNESETVSQRITTYNTHQSASGMNPACSYNCNGSVTASGDCYSYLWSSGDATPSVENLCEGTYAVTMTDIFGFQVIDTVILIAPLEIKIESVLNNVLCFEASDGSIDLTVSGGTMPYSFSWSNGASTEDITGLLAGTYSVTVRDEHGCSKVKTMTINQPDPLVVGAVPAPATCDNNDGGVALIVIGSVPPYTFIWSTGATTQNISGLSAGTYHVTVTDAHGCESTVSTVVVGPTNCDPCANVNCDDNDECTIDACANGQCSHTQIPGCPCELKVTGFTLVHAGFLGDIDSMMDGYVIDRDTLCAFNIRADVCGDVVKSVKFILNGNFFRIEERVPFAFAGDDPQENYHAWMPATGTYTITAIPYDGQNASGNAGASMTITITVVDGPGVNATCICDDHNLCTIDEFVNDECSHTPIICDDNITCTTNDCENGLCVFLPIICDDNNACTTDECVAGDCEYTAIVCDDNDACTTDECIAGDCEYTAIVCDDNDACTTDECIAEDCEYTAVFCDDNDACTTDECVAGHCEYTAVFCNDNEACTTDECVAGHCEYTAIVCDDQDACTIDECEAGVCEYTAIVCDDNDACTTDACVTGECEYTAIVCDDQDACTIDECEAGVCEYTAIVCNDNEACTTDECVAGNCEYTAIVCDDNDACTTDECVVYIRIRVTTIVTIGQCTYTPIPNCPNPCGLEITGFTLVHEGILGDIASLTDGMVINRDTLCRFNIRAEVCDDTAESVKFIVNGSPFRIENTVPYALAGDNPTSDYHAWLPDAGTYTITAIPYSAGGASGTAGVPFSITITILGAADACTNDCNDNNPCTIDENLNGQCVFTEINCSDNNSCTIDACDNGDCTHHAVGCDDDDLCTTDDCSTGECLFTSIVCDDNNACTSNECVIGLCVFNPVTIEITHEHTDVTDTCGAQGNQLCLLDFAGLPHGTILTGEEYAAYGIHISWSAYPNTWTNTPNINQLIIFNTFATGTWDHDLQVGIGNIAIFPENLTDADLNGLVDIPNDTRWGGQQIYSFDFDRTVLSVTIVDHDKDGGSLTAYDQFNNVIVSVPIPTLADGQIAVVPVNAMGVRRLVIDDNDSGGTSDISFACDSVCCNATAEISADGGTAPYTYLWSTGDTIALVEALCEGTYSVTVVDANGCSQVEYVVIGAEQQVQFRMVEKEFSEYSAYPVPFNDLIFVEYTAREEGKVVFTLYTTMGQSVYHNEMMADKGVNRTSLSLGDVALDGMYFLELRKNDYVEYIKVSKYH